MGHGSSGCFNCGAYVEEDDKRCRQCRSKLQDRAFACRPCGCTGKRRKRPWENFPYGVLKCPECAGTGQVR